MSEKSIESDLGAVTLRVSALREENCRLHDRIKVLETAFENVKAANHAYVAENEKLRYTVDGLQQQMGYMIAPPIMTRPPEGKAILFEFGGPTTVQEIEWRHEFSQREPRPTEHIKNRYGRPFRLLYYKKDPAHQFHTLALYVPE